MAEISFSVKRLDFLTDFGCINEHETKNIESKKMEKNFIFNFLERL